MATNLKSGDTVRLKSGGPLMTIQSWTGNFCNCSWFDGTELKFGRFHPDSVVPAQK